VNRKTWRCWVCGVGGDAAELVKRINHCDFPAAVRFLADLSGVLPPSMGRAVRPPPAPVATKPSSPSPEQPSGLPLAEASTLVDEATDCLWGPGGQNARACLHGRGLTDETIRAAGVHARRLDPDSGWGPLLSVLRGRHSLEGRRPADPDQDPSSGRWQAEVRGSLLRSSAHLSRPGCHSTRQVSDRH
jgi:hypothetical protein